MNYWSTLELLKLGFFIGQRGNGGVMDGVILGTTGPQLESPLHQTYQE